MKGSNNSVKKLSPVSNPPNASTPAPAVSTCCLYYTRDGYCAKGDYCTFSHSHTRPRTKVEKQNKYKPAAVPGPPKNLPKSDPSNSNNNSKASTSPSPLINPAAAAAADRDEDHNSALNTSYLSSASTNTNTNTNNHHHQMFMKEYDPWGSGLGDGIYFYGASGTHFENDAVTYNDNNLHYPSTSTVHSPKKYSEVVGKHVDDEFPPPPPPAAAAEAYYHTNTDNYNTSKSSKTAVCSFFLAGNCRYGAMCRNSHDVGGHDEYEQWAEQMLLQQEIEDAQNAECGICFTKLEGNTLGMLSHCSCVFCLNCIRAWRQEGLAIAKSEQVRLCPLCRTESYFVVPCLRLVKDPARKQVLVENYKISLKNTPCKYYQNDGNCPFGTSCFYNHVKLNGEVESIHQPRVVTGIDNSHFKPSTTLADYFKVNR